MPNSDPWGCSGAPFMIIFGSYVDPHFLNTGYFLKYMGVYEGI